MSRNCISQWLAWFLDWFSYQIICKKPKPNKKTRSIKPGVKPIIWQLKYIFYPDTAALLFGQYHTKLYLFIFTQRDVSPTGSAARQEGRGKGGGRKCYWLLWKPVSLAWCFEKNTEGQRFKYIQTYVWMSTVAVICLWEDPWGMLIIPKKCKMFPWHHQLHTPTPPSPNILKIEFVFSCVFEIFGVFNLYGNKNNVFQTRKAEKMNTKFRKEMSCP